MFRTLYTLFSRPLSRALGLSFAINSILFGSWVTRIPEVKANLALSESALGFALLGISVGGLIMMPFTPILMHRLGAGRLLVLTTILACLVPILLILAPSFWLLIVAAILFGMVNGTMDVVMNATTATLEQQEDIAIMSSCHGMFSLGGMLGALLGSLFVGLEVDALQHLLFIGGAMLLLAFVLRPIFLQLPESEVSEEGFAVPSKPLIGLAIIGFCIMLGEGAIADWSAIYLKEVLKSSPFLVGLGFAGFNLTMMLGRFYGDLIIPKLGAKNVVTYGSLIGSLGIAIIIVAPQASWGIIGFTLVGIGFAGIVPILFRAAANVEGIAAGIGVASVTTSGILGFLLGPALIGFISDGFGLKIGMGLVFVLSLTAFFTARYIARF